MSRVCMAKHALDLCLLDYDRCWTIYSGPSITHLITKLPSLSFPAFVISKASSASVNLKVCVNKGLRSTKPRATRSMASGLKDQPNGSEGDKSGSLLVPATVSPTTLDCDFLSRDSEHGYCDVGGPESSLDICAAIWSALFRRFIPIIRTQDERH